MMSLVPNASLLEAGLASLTDRIDQIPAPARDLWDPQRCPVDMLPYLAWARGVVPWDAEWPEDVRRACIEAAIPTHRRAGTAWALRRILGALNITLDIEEWWQRVPQGTPATMILTAYVNRHLSGESVLSPQTYRAIQAAVDATVPVRVHTSLNVAAGWRAGLGADLSTRPHAVARRTVQPMAETAQTLAVAAAVVTRPRAIVRRASQPAAQTGTGSQIGAGLVTRPRAIVRVHMELAA